MIRLVTKEAFALYLRLGRRLALVTALIYLPFTIALLALTLVTPDTKSTQQSIAIIEVVGSLLLFAPLASIVVIRSAMAVENDEPLPLRQAVGDAFELLPTYVITQLLVLLVIVALPGMLIVGGWLSGSQLLLTIGIGTLIGSAILNGVRLGVTTVAVVTGDARMAPALRHSAQLTRGRYWSVLGVLVVFTLFALSIALVIQSLGLAAPAGTIDAVVTAILSVITSALTVPLIALGTYRLYRRIQDAQRA
ncbi:MAG: hypothetical protein EXQ67_01830 [Thermoleophilia bacterium]|nr:hypothetical protein [Thermoleophilia bacterium]